MKIAHIINVIKIQKKHEANYLHIAQPITIQSMINAKNATNNEFEIELYAVKHESENVDVPSEFTMTRNLQRFCYDVIDDLPKTKDFPLIYDIINNLYDASDADYFIYTNLDIGLFEKFYNFVGEKINEGFDAFCINRRIMPKEIDGEIIIENNFQKVFKLKGDPHPGIDCFVLKRSAVPNMNFGNVFIGAPPVGQVIKTQMERTCNNFYWFKDKYVTFHLGNDAPWWQGYNVQDDSAFQRPIFWTQNLKEANGYYDQVLF